MLVLHHAWRSSASRRVRLCLEEKGLAYESRPVDLAKMEHHTAQYLSINPNGVIPTLVPFVKRIEEEIAPDAVTAARHPRVTEWWKTIQARPAFGRANIGPFVDT